ncbi:MAG: transporter [Verrucomicrobia bacterium]|jgi:hypothetical protein|nr:transporter [Verrucomicrobiota bacterium]MDI9380745.1 transporter [Verrucomicrobiota bacterium]NMD20084.1 transporter [Verrucomicrobiota bacterium]HNV00203.1 transporter [Verrucomicrobiota bacterium]HOA60586.1 transporter [Verrucomicrobiota bacterium]
MKIAAISTLGIDGPDNDGYAFGRLISQTTQSIMKHQYTASCSLRLALCGAGWLALAAGLQAQPSFGAHYPIGVEGLKGGSVPPPGLYLRDYNQFYMSDRLKNSGVDDFDLLVYAQAPRLIWITNLKLLGAHYGADVLVPFIYTDLEVRTPDGKFKDSTFGLGDIFVEPITLSWHCQKFDLGVGYGFWAPTGDSDPGLSTAPGKGYWGHMFTLGGTWFPDAQKTWSVSLLNRYEINHESDDYPAASHPYSITAGDVYSLEAGIGKSLSKVVEIGAVGYYQQQTTKDRGTEASNDLDRVFAVGPEISLTFPEASFFASLRYLYEFGAKYRSEGHTLTLTLTKRF